MQRSVRRSKCEEFKNTVWSVNNGVGESWGFPVRFPVWFSVGFPTKNQTSVSIFGFLIHQACEPIIYYRCCLWCCLQPLSSLYHCSQVLPDPNSEPLNNKADGTTFCASWSQHDPVGLWDQHILLPLLRLMPLATSEEPQLLESAIAGFEPETSKQQDLHAIQCTVHHCPYLFHQACSPSYTTTAVYDAACNLWVASTIAVSYCRFRTWDL